jgi:phosphoglycerate kinase
MKTLTDYNFKDKKVLIRVDFNVPLDANFHVTDTTRIEAAKPTILKILEDGGSCVLMSHLGRPNGKEEKYSLKHIVSAVSDVLGVTVKFVPDCIGKIAEEAVANLSSGEVILLENLRFYPEEKKGDLQFAKQLSLLGDFYVNDAFGTAHRAHASTTVIAQFFPNKKCAGYLLASEVLNINKVLFNNTPPVVAIIGGAKVSSKITVLENILDKVDHIIIGGGMAFTFIKALGGDIGNSLVEDDMQPLALEILKKASEKNTKIHLPIDAIIANAFSQDAQTQIVSTKKIPDGWMGLDVGPETNTLFKQIVLQSKTILWNGPVGVFEMEKFATGTLALGKAIGEATKNGAFSLVGGGDSVAAVKKLGLTDQVSYISTGGGAMLEMLEGKELPGIKALEE